jgi:hypothetical protein
MPANRSDIQDALNKAWYGKPNRTVLCQNCQQSVILQAHENFNLGFYAGARWAIFYSSQLSPMFNKFVHMLTILWPDETASIEDKSDYYNEMLGGKQ